MNFSADSSQYGKTGAGGEDAGTNLPSDGSSRAYHSSETEALAEEKNTKAPGKAQAERRISAVKINLLEEILFIHTKEVIE